MTPDIILRSPRNRNYKTIGLAGLDDKRLSLRAKGLLMYLITRPNTWKFHRNQLVKLSRDGRDAVKKALSELTELGYLHRTPIREGTRFAGQRWTVSESPNPEWISKGLQSRPAETPSCGNTDGQDPSPTEIAADISNKDTKQEEVLETKKDENNTTAAASPPKSDDPRILEVFVHWQAILGYQDRNLTKERRGHINARLRDGFTVEQLKAVVDHAKADPYLQGDNDRNRRFDDIPNLFRNTARVEQYLARRNDPRNSPASELKPEYPDHFERTWAAYPKRAGGNSKVKAFKAWSARLNNGVVAEEIHAGVERYAAYCQAAGKTGTEYVKQAATFFGPDEHYLEPWTPPRTDSRADPRLYPSDKPVTVRRF